MADDLLRTPVSSELRAHAALREAVSALRPVAALGYVVAPIRG